MITPIKPRFVVGIDFGTTFTSVAYSHSASPDEVKMVQTWPHCGTRNPTSDQVPTELHYSDPSARTCGWGYNIPKNPKNPVEALRWFKLLLQERGAYDSSTQSLGGLEDSAKSLVISAHSLTSALSNLGLSQGPPPPFMRPSSTPADRTAMILKDIGIEPATVVEDFLSGVRECTVKNIEGSYDPEWVRASKIEYVLTVPAIWSDSAKNLMVQAATKAGFGEHRTDFHLVSEPEAAAAYTLKAIQPNELNVNDTFVICDAGGGTVDLISYKIEGLNPLKICESVTGSGDLCGSVYLDHRFEHYIRRKLGDKVIDGMKPRSKIEMMNSWVQKVKFMFGNTTGLEGFEVHVLGVKDNPEKNVEDCFHTMEMGDVAEIFDPVVNRIITLVQDQVRDVEKKGGKVGAILLVGGFGSSAYLAQRLREMKFGAQARNISVLQPVNAQIAIARGALIRGLDGSIVSERRARRFYGTIYDIIFNPSLGNSPGPQKNKVFSSADEMWYLRGRMQWYIQKGMAIGKSKSAKVSFMKYVPTYHHSTSFIFHHTVYACDQDNAQNFQWKNPDAIVAICTLRSDLSKVGITKFPKTTNSYGIEYYRIEFELEMSVVDEVLRFELIYEGKSYGLVSTKFE